MLFGIYIYMMKVKKRLEIVVISDGDVGTQTRESRRKFHELRIVINLILLGCA